MTAINENLKQIRQAGKFTQEYVAGQIGVTRQAVSSYESGRTRPDLETLKRFAEVYNVEIGDILYGRSRMRIKLRRVKIVAVIALIDMLLCNLAESALIWTANRYFHLENGMLTAETTPIFQTRTGILNARNTIEAFSVVSFGILCIAMLVLLATLERPVPVSVKLKYLAALAAGSAITILPWSLSDRVYGLLDYSLTAVRNLLFAVVVFGLSFIVERIAGNRESSGRL